MTLVMKFGGTSVGNAEAMRQTAELIEKFKAEWGNVVVIASAMGSKPIKVTDLLNLLEKGWKFKIFSKNAKKIKIVPQKGQKI